VSQHESGSGEETHFGNARVPLAEKQHLVNSVFGNVAARYDLMNDLMSGGMHRLWKRTFVGMVRPSRHRPFKHLDVAGGTGDIAFRVAAAGGGPQTEVTVADISEEMLRIGEERAARTPGGERVRFVTGNAEDLPFPDNSFDCYTIAFGIRNVPRIDRALAEARRVLKHGARFLCLEFSDVDVPLLDRVYEAYSFTAIPALGKVVTGDGDAYRYLVESIRCFPRADRFRDMIAAAGLQRAAYQRLSGGIVAIHSAWKL
jgi:demethylmenaquinone methyltransferase / 2-methoxy-6-polyprenyl-1,4-benzoquinol methylase